MSYIKKTGPLSYEHGRSDTGFAKSTIPRTKNSDVILDLVKQGKRMSEIVALYSSMHTTVAKLMQYRPRRQEQTQLLYLWGPSGIGKTTMVYRVLKTIQEMGLCDYFSKGGGLKKYWDGYDNQPITWIDDPVAPDSNKDSESVQQLKNVISTGDCIVEIKYGTMVFDSSILIITSNMSPQNLAVNCGEENYQAIYRRLNDTCGSFQLVSCGSDHYIGLIKAINKAIDPKNTWNVDNIIDKLPVIQKRDYSEAAKLLGKRCMYFDDVPSIEEEDEIKRPLKRTRRCLFESDEENDQNVDDINETVTLSCQEIIEDSD